MGLIYEAGTEDGCESLIVRVKCTKPCIPNKERTYAMKVLTNYFKTQTQTQVSVKEKGRCIDFLLLKGAARPSK